MPTTRRANTPSLTERLRRVYVPCPENKGNTSVTIKVFDKHKLISEMIDSDDMVTELQNFLNGMAASPGLQADVKKKLSSISFVVRYESRSPTKEEIEGFGVTDFPVHLLTASGLIASSSQDIVNLMVAHKIPEKTSVAIKTPGENETSFTNVFPYKTIEDDWENDEKVLGIGIPGTYFLPNLQTRCRKVGFIKMRGSMTLNLPLARLPEKILFVLKHELGHMFGLDHQNNTMMDRKYNLDLASRYTNDELIIVSRALGILLQL